MITIYSKTLTEGNYRHCLILPTVFLSQHCRHLKAEKRVLNPFPLLILITVNPVIVKFLIAII